MRHFTRKGGNTYRVCFVSPNSPGRKGSRWGQKPGELDPFAPSRLKLFSHTQFTFPSEPSEAASQSSTVAFGRSCLRPSLVQFDTPRNAPLQSPSRHRRTSLRPLTTAVRHPPQRPLQNQRSRTVCLHRSSAAQARRQLSTYSVPRILNGGNDDELVMKSGLVARGR